MRSSTVSEAADVTRLDQVACLTIAIQVSRLRPSPVSRSNLPDASRYIPATSHYSRISHLTLLTLLVSLVSHKTPSRHQSLFQLEMTVTPACQSLISSVENAARCARNKIEGVVDRMDDIISDVMHRGENLASVAGSRCSQLRVSSL